MKVIGLALIQTVAIALGVVPRIRYAGSFWD
jgi:hypothetical protein